MLENRIIFDETKRLFSLEKIKSFYSNKKMYFCNMETIRQQKVAGLIHKEMTAIFQKEGYTMIGGSMLTITNVRVPKDLSIARINISIFGSADKKEIISILKAKTKEIRFLLGNAVKNQLRIVPTLEFYSDESLDHLDRINQLLKE